MRMRDRLYYASVALHIRMRSCSIFINAIMAVLKTAIPLAFAVSLTH